MGTSRPAGGGWERGQAYRFILLLGLVSLFADATYESARSILGQFLASLGATATSVGLIAGGGELLNNGLRAFSGYLTDRTRRPWRLTLLGFTANMLSVPLLALATTPVAAAALVFAERTGKAIRNPPRDTMLSNAARRVGAGRGFGTQEALGQIGAVIGPLLIGLLVTRGLAYRLVLGMLAVPAALTLVVLVVTRFAHPDPGRFEASLTAHDDGRIPRIFWIFVVGSALTAAGYLDFTLVAFSLVSDGVHLVGRIPRLYALAMGMQAIAAVGSGHLFDRRPLATLLLACIISVPVAMLAFGDGSSTVVAAVVLWGLGLGAQKTIFKATIAVLVPLERRATAYGVFFAVFGLAWFLGSAVMGRLHDSHRGLLAGFSAGCQVLALPPMILVGRRLHRAARRD